ncbi:MAG: alpha/beta hydrolase [Oscillospiraceae bacterium]
MIYDKIKLDVPYEKAGLSAEGCEAVLTEYIPDELPNDSRHIPKKAVIICPGGGYDYCSVREAEPVAVRFLSYGVTAFVLNYSCVNKLFPTNLLELAAAVKYVRDNAARLNIDPHGIFVCGFSAGGHLAASLGVHWNKPFAYEPLGAAAEDIRPDGQILCYPVITAGEKRHDGSIRNITGGSIDNDLARLVSPENNVTADVPPTFIWSTFDDELVPVENTIMFTAALAEHKVPFTSHIFSHGVHGLALSDDSTANYDGHINGECAKWFDMALEWIKQQK